MCKPKNIQTNLFDSGGTSTSDIYNTVPLMQFDSCNDGTGEAMFFHNTADQKGTSLQKQSFISSYYKVYNIQLVDKLEKCVHAAHPTIQAQVKGLSCCSHLSKVLVHDGNGHSEPNAFIQGTSAKCRKSLCPRCNSIKATKLKKRFFNAYESEECQELFEDKHFYLITLTLKHNTNGTRSEVYLNQLKRYVANLRRSEIWQQYFPYSKNNPASGYAQSYELTLTDNGFHIHSHILMCAPRIQHKIKKVEDAFRLKWFQLTGDSTGFRLDLVKTGNTTKDTGIKKGIKLEKILGEILKYTVKAGTDKKISDSKSIKFESGKLIGMDLSKIDLLAEWLICTRGQKMLTSNGFFKGMELFKTGKSKWDFEDEEDEPIGNAPRQYRYFVGKTAQLKYNYSLTKGYSKVQRYSVLDDIFIKEIPRNFIEITNCVDEFDKYFKLLVNDSDTKNFLKSWVTYCENQKIEQELTQEFIDKLSPTVVNAEYNSIADFIELSLFTDV